MASACLIPEALIEQITDESITASSYYTSRATHAPVRSRFTTLDDETGEGGWVTHYPDHNQWIQAEFLIVKSVVKVATKGRNNENQWVTEYQLKYGLSSNETNLEYVTSAGWEAITFEGNSDRDSVAWASAGFFPEGGRIFLKILRLIWVHFHSPKKKHFFLYEHVMTFLRGKYVKWMTMGFSIPSTKILKTYMSTL